MPTQKKTTKRKTTARKTPARKKPSRKTTHTSLRKPRQGRSRRKAMKIVPPAPTDEITIPKKIDVSDVPVPQMPEPTPLHKHHTAAWLVAVFITLVALTAVVYAAVYWPTDSDTTRTVMVSPNTNTTPCATCADPAGRSATNTNVDESDVYTLIRTRIAMGATVTIEPNQTISDYPTDISAQQIQDLYILDDIHFAQVVNRNLNFAVESDDAAIAWWGLLVSKDDGASWQRYYTVKSEDVVHNVVGLMVHDGMLYLDVADDRGAGSGEGNLTRFTSIDGGRTWSYGGCYYLVPESYYGPSVDERTGFLYGELQASESCIYDSVTAG